MQGTDAAELNPVALADGVVLGAHHDGRWRCLGIWDLEICRSVYLGLAMRWTKVKALHGTRDVEDRHRTKSALDEFVQLGLA